MRYTVHEPSAPLDGVVSYFWSLQDAPGHERERILPSGTIELVLNLEQDEFRIHRPSTGDESCRRLTGAIISGCYRSPFEIETRQHASVIGVHFSPGGAARVLGLRPGEIADAHVDLEQVWGHSALELRERLCVQSDPRERFRILEQALLVRMSSAPSPRGAVRAALADLDQPRVEVGEVTRRLGLSRRRVIEIFTEDVGMTPKRYSRVRRFQRALALVSRHPATSWGELALVSGYFDQAHLCREWSELTGVSPQEFLRLHATPSKENHLALSAQRPESNSSKTPRHPGRRLPLDGATPHPQRNL